MDKLMNCETLVARPLAPLGFKNLKDKITDYRCFNLNINCFKWSIN